MADTQHRWLAPLTFLITFALLSFAAMPLFDDPDVPWHIAAGQLMLSTHHFPATDPWSFVTKGLTWYNLSWLWDLKLAVIESVAGPLGVFLFAMACSAALLAFMAWTLLRRGIALPPVLLTLFIATFCMIEFATARPHLAGYALILLFAFILHESRAGFRKLFFLPPLMALWVNMHGSFLIGFTLLAAYIVDAYVTKNHAWLHRLILISIACALCTLVNPYGINVYKGIMVTMDSVARDYIAEWQAFAFGQSIGISLWLVAFLLASNIKTSRATLADKILAFFWLISALTAQRNGAIFMLVSAPYLATCIDAQTSDLQKPLHIASWLERASAKKAWLASIVLALIFSAAISALPHNARLESEKKSPADAIDFAMKNYPTHHFLTDYNLGGRVIYQTGGKLPMFMDSRAGTAYSEQELKDYAYFLITRNGWEEKMADYGVNAILVGNDQNFVTAYANGHYHDTWKLVFAGKAASVYISAP